MQIDIITNTVTRGWYAGEMGTHLILEAAPTEARIGSYNDRVYDMDTTLIGRVDIPNARLYESDAVIINDTVYTARLSQDGAALLIADMYCKSDEYNFSYPIQASE